MDIPQDQSLWVKHRWLLIIVVLFGVLAATAIAMSDMLMPSRQQSSDVTVAKVKTQPFSKVISAYGELRPQQQRTLIGRSAGTVMEIRKRPGEQVNADSIVLVLSNPEVDSAVQKAQLDLQKAEAELAALRSDLLDQRLSLDNERRLLEAEISTKRAELEAQEELARNAIVSKLDLRKAQMQLRQLEIKLELATKRVESAETALAAKLSSGELQVQQARYLLEISREKQDALNVRAGMQGVLESQESSLALGQWIAQGASLGIVSSNDSLFAELNVNAADASSVQLGMPVTLSVRGHRVTGEVMRVAPNASQNQVQVDVALQNELPKVARSNIDVRGDIAIVRRDNAHVLPRPAHYREGDPLMLYQHQQGDQYSVVEVPVLEASKDYIQLADSVAVGTEFVLSDPANWERASIIQL